MHMPLLFVSRLKALDMVFLVNWLDFVLGGGQMHLRPPGTSDTRQLEILPHICNGCLPRPSPRR